MGQRLTERRGDTVTYIGKHTRLPGMDCAGTMRVAAARDVMERLAQYEDTGLSPAEVVAMQQYIDGAVQQIVQTIVALAPQLAATARAAIQSMTPEQIMELLQDNLRKN